MKTYNTKKRQRAKEIKKLQFSILFVAIIISVSLIMGNSITEDFAHAEVNFRAKRHLPLNENKIEMIDVSKGTIREITMYNSLPEQTDSTPCISADGTNICEVDYNVCATNAFPFGTKLYIDKLGECIVKDRMNKRYSERIDWYAGMDKDRAINFGVQKLLVSVK